MTVMTREAWTDERLDDLNHRVDEGFREVRQEFRAVRSEMHGLHRTTMVVMCSGFGTMLVGFGGTIATILLTQ
jgi:hypothetical protein